MGPGLSDLCQSRGQFRNSVQAELELKLESQLRYSELNSEIFPTQKCICRTGRVHVHCRCVRLCECVFIAL